jgi:SAM-dependent methyltransferase
VRDPDATLRVGETGVTRYLRQPLPESHFLHSPLASRWVGEGRLVPFTVRGPQHVEAERLPFVSQPTEWCDTQLFDAARLTLDLQAEAVAEGFDLKDASAWNVLFSGAKPVFCDLLSFVPLVERKWWAAGQFARHFILPLALRRVKGVHARNAFLVSRDGLLPEEARRLFGWSRFLTRYWLAMAGGGSAAKAPPSRTHLVAESPSAIVAHRRGLHETFSWMVQGGRPAGAPTSHWSAYRDERGHYPVGSVERKRELMQSWLRTVSPGWVLDLGCNTGEFSRLSADAGARVVAIDGDHDAVQSLYQSLRGSQAIHPLIASLDDMSGGRGWEGREHPGLAQRLAGAFDLVLMLALVHHLAVSNSVPLSEVAAFVKRCTRSWAVVEWIDETDPQMVLLCSQRQRQPAEFAMALQRQAFLDAGFDVVEEVVLHPASRRLALLKVRQ